MTLRISAALVDALWEHSEREHPIEACGVIAGPTATGTPTRRYTVVLGGGSSSGWVGSAAGMNLPKISLVEIGFVAARTGTTYGTLGESLTQSAGTGGGFLTLIATAVPGTSEFGAINGVGFTVPALGAAAAGKGLDIGSIIAQVAGGGVGGGVGCGEGCGDGIDCLGQLCIFVGY